MNHSFASNPDAKAYYDKIMSNINSTYGVPKSRILVRLPSSLNVFMRNAIANGIK